MALQRKRSTASERRELVRKFYESGMSQSEFAARHDLSLSTLGRWLVRQEQAESSELSFQEVVVPATKPQWAVELVTPGGWTLRLQQAPEAKSLQTLLRSLR